MKAKDILYILQVIKETQQNTLSAHPFTLENIITNYVIHQTNTTLQSIMANAPDAELSEEDIKTLLNLQKDFFELFKNTNAIAVHTPRMFYTQYLLSLAYCLAEATSKHYYEILFPSLSVLNYEASGTHLSEQDVSLTEFILSDDNTAIIEVIPCLTFAAEDGILKHNYCDDGKIKPLSATETMRIIHHSTGTKNLWEITQNKINYTKTDNSFGSVLQRFANSLKYGDVHGGLGGEEFNASAIANVAIYNFHTWFQKIKSKERKTLKTLKDNDLTLWQILKRLFYPIQINDQEITYCINILGGKIENIINNHPELYTQYPQNQKIRSEDTYEQLKKEHEAATEQLQKTIGEENYQVLSTYASSPETLLKRLLELSHNNTFLENQIALFISNRNTLSLFLDIIKPENRIFFLEKLKNTLKSPLNKIGELIAKMPDHPSKLQALCIFAQPLLSQISQENTATQDIPYLFTFLEKEQYSQAAYHLYMANPVFFQEHLYSFLYILEKIEFDTKKNSHYMELLAHFVKNPIGIMLFFSFCFNNFKLSDPEKETHIKNYFNQELFMLFSKQSKTFALLLDRTNIQNIFYALKQHHSPKTTNDYTDTHLVEIFKQFSILASKRKKTDFVTYCIILVKDPATFFTHPAIRGQFLAHELQALSKKSSFPHLQAIYPGNPNLHLEPQNFSFPQEASILDLTPLYATGLSKRYISQYLQVKNGNFTVMHYYLLAYLITGVTPSDYTGALRPCVICPILYTEAIAEMTQLNQTALLALWEFYAKGLRGYHLRAFIPAPDRDSQKTGFGAGHLFALRECINTQKMSPEEAIQTLQGLSEEQASNAVFSKIHTSARPFIIQSATLTTPTSNPPQAQTPHRTPPP